jgi:hypothetical protein
LVDEAELTVVVARSYPIEQRALDLGAERFAVALGDFDHELDVAAAHVDLHLRFVDEIPPLDDVAGHLTVQADDLVAGLQPGECGR